MIPRSGHDHDANRLVIVDDRDERVAGGGWRSPRGNRWRRVIRFAERRIERRGNEVAGAGARVQRGELRLHRGGVRPHEHEVAERLGAVAGDRAEVEGNRHRRCH